MPLAKSNPSQTQKQALKKQKIKRNSTQLLALNLIQYLSYYHPPQTKSPEQNRKGPPQNCQHTNSI